MKERGVRFKCKEIFKKSKMKTSVSSVTKTKIFIDSSKSKNNEKSEVKSEKKKNKRR